MTRIFKKTLAFFALFTVELLFIWVVFISCLLLFLFLGHEILKNQELNFDMRAFAFADSLGTPIFDSFMKSITFFASRDFIAGASLMLIFYFLIIRRHRWYSIKVPVIALGSISLNLILKFLFDRDRPIIPHLVKSYGLSFPSGHAMISASFYGLLIYLVWVNVKNPVGRWALVIALILFIVLIGFSRVYLHVHYASDVVAGFAAGLLWVIIALFVLKRIERYSRRNIAPIVEVPA